MFISAIAVILSACGIDPVGGNTQTSLSFTYRQAYLWPRSNPAAQGMDSIKVSAGLQQIRNNPFIYSFLVVRNDSLVLDYYTTGYTEENDFEIYSASKSFTSALVGIAIDKGIIRSVQEKVLKFFPDYDTTKIDPRKRDWTLEHFLTMRSGIDWNESDDHSTLFNSGANWLFTALGLPLKYAPGEKFIYTTPNANVLSGIITRAAGMSTYKFAEANLFEPLKISVRAWAKDPQDVYTGGTGMRFTPRDLARFGQLYLHSGFIEGRQIVSRQWIQQTLIPRNPQNTTRGDLSAVNYGYMWWTDYESTDSLFMAAGFAGQAIYVIPAKNMVAVTIASGDVSAVQADTDERVIIGILKKYFL